MCGKRKRNADESDSLLQFDQHAHRILIGSETEVLYVREANASRIFYTTKCYDERCMNKKNILVASIVIIVIVASVYFWAWKAPNNPPSSTIPVSVSQSEWKTYTNTKYGYILQYPRSVYVQPRLEEERLPLEESFSIEMGMPGGIPPVGITITIWEPYTPKPMDSATIEHNRIVNLDLKSFAETLRQQEIDNKNPNFPNKKVGGLKKLTSPDKKHMQ